jgi:hypothetical protein
MEFFLPPQCQYYLTPWEISSQMLAAIQCKNAEKCTALLAKGVDADQVFKISSVTKPAICLATERGAPEIGKYSIYYVFI